MLHRNLHMEDLANLQTSKGEKSGGVFGFLRSLNKALKACPIDYFPVICWDSRVSQRRLDLFPNYKHQEERNKDSEYRRISKLLIESPDEVSIEKYSEDEIEIIKVKMNEMLNNKSNFGTYDDPNDYLSNYVTQRNLVIDICNSLGIPNIKYRNWEGDDLMTLLTRISNSSIIVSDDSDMQQLISKDVSILRVLREVRIVNEEDIKSWGYPDAHFIAVVKAITGDNSDNVPQVAFRLGKVTAEKISHIMHSCNYNPEKYLKVIADTLKGKVISSFIENHDNFIRNLGLVDLSLVEDDTDVYNHIYATIKGVSSSYMEVVKKLSRLEISAVDLDQIMSHVLISSEKLYEV